MSQYCNKCGKQLSDSANVCDACGATLKPQANANGNPIIVNVENHNVNANGRSGREKNKWVAWILCTFFGLIGAHKFYEGKIGLGILYLFTGGLFGIGAFIDWWVLLFKHNPYYV